VSNIPQVALLNVDGFVISSYAKVEKPTIAIANSAPAHRDKKITKLFCEKVVASRYSSFIKEIGLV